MIDDSKGPYFGITIAIARADTFPNFASCISASIIVLKDFPLPISKFVLDFKDEFAAVDTGSTLSLEDASVIYIDIKCPDFALSDIRL